MAHPLDLPQILISHPGRQHSHHTALALYEGTMLMRYYTSLWYKSGLFPYKLFDFFSGSGSLKFKNQCPTQIDRNLVSQIPLYEIVHQGIGMFSKKSHEKLIHWRNTHFDRIVSEKLKIEPFDIFLGYETSSLCCFEEAKNLGKMTVLDLAIAHYAYQQKIYDLIGASGSPLEKHFVNRVNEIKEMELRLADSIFVGSQFVKDTLVQAGVSKKKNF